MTIRFTADALRSIRGKRAWWEQHREKAPRLFVEEFAAVVAKLRGGTDAERQRYAVRSGRIIWRILMPKTRHHVYYRLNEWQTDALTRALRSVLVVPLTTNLDRAHLAGTAVGEAGEGGLSETSVALAFQMRTIPKTRLAQRIRALTDDELAELELATEEALGRAEPE